MQAISTPSSSASPVAAAERRHDVYAGIHKALRLYMTDTLSQVGATDPRDDAEVQASLDRVHELMGDCELHIHDEDTFVHPALEQALGGASRRIADEHVHHHDAIADLRDLCGLVADTQGPARGAAMARLYHALSLFMADNFEHMHHEETVHNPLLWAHYSDEQLLGIEGAIVASIPPAAMFRLLHWFIPAMSAPERAGMLGGMQAGMPPEAFRGVLEIARARLSGGDFAKLVRELNIAPTV